MVVAGFCSRVVDPYAACKKYVRTICELIEYMYVTHIEHMYVTHQILKAHKAIIRLRSVLVAHCFYQPWHQKPASLHLISAREKTTPQKIESKQTKVLTRSGGNALRLKATKRSPAQSRCSSPSKFWQEERSNISIVVPQHITCTKHPNLRCQPAITS